MVSSLALNSSNMSEYFVPFGAYFYGGLGKEGEH